MPPMLVNIVSKGVVPTQLIAGMKDRVRKFGEPGCLWAAAVREKQNFYGPVKARIDAALLKGEDADADADSSSSSSSSSGASVSLAAFADRPPSLRAQQVVRFADDMPYFNRRYPPLLSV